jgi:hypothetical protein
MPVSVRSSTLYNPIIPLKTTFADCENTTSEIDIVTVTIPANALELGDIIVLEIMNTALNNTGSGKTVVTKIKTTTDVRTTSATTINATSSTYIMSRRASFFVTSISGSNATLKAILSSGTAGGQFLATSLNMSSPTGNIAMEYDFAVDKTISNNLKIATILSTDSSNLYIRVESAQAYIIKKAV